MPERSYKYYPEKGHLKVSHQSREFGQTGTDSLSEKYVEHLERHEKQYIDYVLRPSKHGGIIKEKVLLDKLTLDGTKEPFR